VLLLNDVIGLALKLEFVSPKWWTQSVLEEIELEIKMLPNI
jgi:hypothetical protein